MSDKMTTTTSKSIPTTIALHKQEERMNRTREVKKRLGPIMDRMKSSLARIQALEDSLQLDSAESDTKTEDESVIVPITGVERSRTLLKRSMEMLKKKLYTLQRMEEMWYSEEDRRQNLQHYFLQVSLSKPCVELAATRRHNEELIREVEELEKERHSLEAKCDTFAQVEKKAADLSDKLQKQQTLQAKLDETTSQRDQLELDLVQRQSKINEQAFKIDELECQVEQLTAACNELLSNLRRAESREEKLSLRVLELQHANRTTQRGRSGPPRMIQSKQSSDSSSTKSTDNSTNASLQSHSDDKDGTSGLDTLGKASPAKTAGTANSSFLSHEGSICLPGDVDTSAISIFEDDDEDECSAFVNESCDAATIEKLTSKVEELRLKNAGLVQSQQENFGKFHALLQDNARQAARIQELERQLAKQENKEVQAPASPKQEKPGRGYFFKRLLKADAQELKQMIEGGGTSAEEKARQISQGLAAHPPPNQ